MGETEEVRGVEMKREGSREGELGVEFTKRGSSAVERGRDCSVSFWGLRG